MRRSPPATTNSQSSQHRDRRWARYPCADGALVVVKADQEQFQAFAVDESIGGLGIETHDPAAITEGQVVDVLYRDEQMQGQVTGIKPKASSGCRISICWQERLSRSEDEVQATHFQHGAVTIVCRSKTDCADGQANITLWNSRRFKVAVDQLTRRTAQARFTELQTMGEKRDVIAELHSLDVDGCPQEISARILEFEFDANALLGTSANAESASDADQIGFR